MKVMAGNDKLRNLIFECAKSDKSFIVCTNSVIKDMDVVINYPVSFRDFVRTKRSLRSTATYHIYEVDLFLKYCTGSSNIESAAFAKEEMIV